MARKKTTTPKAYCFVLMPFDSAFDDVYQLGIKEACSEVGAFCERVDEQIFHESILDRIYNQIAKSDVVIADMTGRNANVFYEVGYAHALGKRTILLTKKADDIPFDLKHFPHIVYGNSIAALRDDLKTRVDWCIQNPPETAESGTVDIELFLGTNNLSADDVVYVCPNGEVSNPLITIHNASAHAYAPGDFKLGVITDAKHRGFREGADISTPLPDGTVLHILPQFDTLFPQQFTSHHFILDESPPVGGEQLTLRVFSSAGTRDYKLELRRHDDG